MENNILANQTKERRTKIADDAGGHQHNSQGLQKIVGHPANLICGSGGGMGDPVQQTCPKALLIPTCRSTVLNLLGGVWADWIVASMEA